MKKLFFSLPCWGHEYLNKFLNFTVATLLARHNFPVLKSNGYQIVFQIFTKQEFVKIFEKHHHFKKLKQYVKISYHYLDDNHLSNVELFSYAHEQSLQSAAKEGVPVLFLCADALYSNGAFLFAVEKYEQGYQAILAPPFRVNDIDVIEKLAINRDVTSSIELTPDEIKHFILDDLHQDEDDLAFPTQFKAAGWSGIPSWYDRGSFYLKNSPYYNPVLVVAKKGMTLKSETLDNAPFLNELLSNEGCVFICDSIKNIGILDLAPQGVRQLPIDIGTSTPFDLALKVAFKLVHPWQYQVLKTTIVIGEKSNRPLTFALNQRNKFMVSVETNVINILENIERYYYEYIQFISEKYIKLLGIEFSAIQEKINKINSEFSGKKVTLYGGGEFYKFIFAKFNFTRISISVSDKNENILSGLTGFHPTIKVSELETVDVIIPMSLAFEFTMKEYLQKELKITTPVYIAHWHELRENND